MNKDIVPTQNKALTTKIKKDFTRPSFILSVCFISLMMGIVALGNPHFKSFYYHYVPEILAMYCFGIWARQVKFQFKTVLGLSALTVIFWSPMFGGISALPIIAWLALPCPIGYIVEKSNEKQQPRK